MSRNPVHKNDADKDRMAHVFVAKQGYFHVGRLRMPAKPMADAEKCEPPMVVADGSWHNLQPPKGAEPQRMRWHAKAKEWSPNKAGLGNRTGFTSAYLAAHGWTYLGSAAGPH